MIREFGLFHLIWLQLNIQFVEKLSLKVKVIDWQIMIFTQKIWKKSIHYSINYKYIGIYQADISCTLSTSACKCISSWRTLSGKCQLIWLQYTSKVIHLLEKWVKKCCIYQTTNILKGGHNLHVISDGVITR